MSSNNKEPTPGAIPNDAKCQRSECGYTFAEHFGVNHSCPTWPFKEGAVFTPAPEQPTHANDAKSYTFGPSEQASAAPEQLTDESIGIRLKRHSTEDLIKRPSEQANDIPKEETVEQFIGHYLKLWATSSTNTGIIGRIYHERVEPLAERLQQQLEEIKDLHVQIADLKHETSAKPIKTIKLEERLQQAEHERQATNDLVIRLNETIDGHNQFALKQAERLQQAEKQNTELFKQIFEANKIAKESVAELLGIREQLEAVQRENEAAAKKNKDLREILANRDSQIAKQFDYKKDNNHLQSELSRQEALNRELVEAANDHIKDLYKYASGHEVMSHVRGWRISKEDADKFKEHREKWDALIARAKETTEPKG